MIIQRRTSKQRTLIRQYLYGRVDHPTAEKLYNEIREDHPKLSLGTIYRNLMYLKDIGEIQAIDVGDGSTHFDPNPMPHVHFYCEHCHQVSDVPVENYNEVVKEFSKHVQGKVSGSSVTFSGICIHCLRKDAQ